MTYAQWAEVFRSVVRDHETCQPDGCNFEEEIHQALNHYYDERRAREEERLTAKAIQESQEGKAAQ